ncbi:g8295 [Coccomyxa viridis]|uniref:Alpha-1,4 glucan phosphorylase n=1 Tax=Coccomyxa viridis TaxID=1274662 RepID=A0ABP1G006_9CHLO
MAAERRAFLGSKPAVALPTRRQALHFRRRCNTQAILEKAREIVSPSNGASSTSRPSKDPSSVQADVLQNLEFVVGAPSNKIPNGLDAKSVYRGVAASVREHLIDAFNRTQDYWSEKDPKFVYYLSAEFLMGRSLMNAVQNLELTGTYSEAVKQLGYDLETLRDAEQNAALGNGGLGRLAACFIDSMATLNLPGWGYGIRYKYGMFKQAIDEKGYQQELPDIWLSNGNPWEIPRPDITFKIGFYGSVDNFKWSPGETIIAKAYDNPIPGYKTATVGNLRLWEALPVDEFDLTAFNEGKYDKAVEQRRKAEDISAVLYPNDATEYGKELRLKQQFFFVSASLQDALARFKAKHSDNWQLLPEKAVFQMNDTHPTIAVAELMRLLIDEQNLDWDTAWGIVQKTLAFTNHTVMPEALEKWPVKVLGKLLPRHLEIIDKIDSIWKDSLKEKVLAQVEEMHKKNPPKPKAAKEVPLAKKAGAPAVPEQAEEEEEEEEEDPVEAALNKYGIITENPWEKGVKLVNMAYLAVVGSKAVNGVAAIHSDIIKRTIFKDFFELTPNKFQNKTNGVTPRRWLAWCNPGLAALITETLGTDAWPNDLNLLTGLRQYADDKDFQKKWRAIKHENKARLAAKIKERTGIDLPTEPLYDIQIKRIHEYKRQYLNILSVIYRYHEIKTASPEERKKFVPRVTIFGGKAASAYYMAKKIVRLINRVGMVVNKDPDVKDLLKVVFVPDYNVDWAEALIPAAELCQQISTAGTEASGTSNMKFQMNGCLIIGTMDGANIEIAEEVGKENLFIFGMDESEVPAWREGKRAEWKDYDPRFVKALDMIKDGTFGDEEYFQDLADSVSDMSKSNDWFLVAPDFTDYMRAQDDVDKIYQDQDEWTRRSILYTAGSGFFSSDRTIKQYADEIWDVKPVPVPAA